MNATLSIWKNQGLVFQNSCVFEISSQLTFNVVTYLRCGINDLNHREIFKIFSIDELQDLCFTSMIYIRNTTSVVFNTDRLNVFSFYQTANVTSSLVIAAECNSKARDHNNFVFLTFILLTLCILMLVWTCTYYKYRFRYNIHIFYRFILLILLKITLVALLLYQDDNASESSLVLTGLNNLFIGCFYDTTLVLVSGTYLVSKVEVEVDMRFVRFLLLYIFFCTTLLSYWDALTQKIPKTLIENKEFSIYYILVKFSELAWLTIFPTQLLIYYLVVFFTNCSIRRLNNLTFYENLLSSFSLYNFQKSILNLKKLISRMRNLFFTFIFLSAIVNYTNRVEDIQLSSMVHIVDAFFIFLFCYMLQCPNLALYYPKKQDVPVVKEEANTLENVLVLFFYNEDKSTNISIAVEEKESIVV